MAVVPGVAHLMVKAPSPDFITQFITFGDLQHDQPGGFFYGVNGLVKIDPKPGIDLVEATIPLRRGLTVHCQVVGPQGQPVDKAARLTPTDSLIGLNDVNSAYVHVVFNGRLELHGCDPSNLRRIYILDNKNQWGATVDVNADKLQGKTLTVRLLPCGVATMRLVDQDGHPWDSCHPAITVQLVYLNSPASTFDRNWMITLDGSCGFGQEQICAPSNEFPRPSYLANLDSYTPTFYVFMTAAPSRSPGIPKLWKSG